MVKVAEVKQKITEVQQKIEQKIAAPAPFAAIPPAFGVFMRDLVPGQRNDEVRRLQELLASDKEIYPEGITSGYYGTLTRNAVRRFQLKYGVIASANASGNGRFGPKTRAKFVEIFGSAPSAPTPSPEPAPTPAPAAPTAPLTLQEIMAKIQEIQAKITGLKAAEAGETPLAPAPAPVPAPAPTPAAPDQAQIQAIHEQIRAIQVKLIQQQIKLIQEKVQGLQQP